MKVTPEETLAPLIVTDKLLGLNVKPVWLGVIVYVPLANPVKVKLPELSALVVPFTAPLSATVAPLPPTGGAIVPEML